MIRFIHTADIHFGMENYGRIDASTGIHTRLLDFQRALNACIDHAIAQQVDFFLFCGDAYKTTTPSPTQQRLLVNCFLRLYKEAIPIVIIVGNHDHPLSFGKANTLDLFKDLPLDGFHVIAKPTILSLSTKSGRVNIVGIPWPTRNTIALTEKNAHTSAAQLTEYIAQSVATIIQQYAEQLDPKLPAVLASHLTVSSGIFSGSEKRAVYGNDPVLLPSQLGIKPFDYVALGHLHRHQNLNPTGHPPIVYSGSIERIDFGERKENKGFCDVTIEKKGSTSYTFIEVPMRPFVQIEVTLKPGVAEEQTATIIHTIKQHDITNAIVKIVYHLPPNARDNVDLKAVEAACSSALQCVGIIPVRQQAKREQRAQISVDMSLSTLLDHYFQTRPELHNKKDILIEKTLQLRQETCNHDSHEET